MGGGDLLAVVGGKRRSFTVVRHTTAHQRLVPYDPNMSVPGQRMLFDERAHLLVGLSLPSRYENLVDEVGDDIARILVRPGDASIDAAQAAALAVTTRRRGLFTPIDGRTGAGKTTFASNLTHWLPQEFTESATHRGEVTAESLRSTVEPLVATQVASDSRVIPVTVEDRESNAPSDTELAQIKGFLRSSGGGNRCLLLWPETNHNLAVEIVDRYAAVAGGTTTGLPLRADGPPRETWPSIARDTLQLVNGLEGLEHLGVDPADYEPGDFHTIGGYLDAIADEFVMRVQTLLLSTRKPVRVAVVFASESDSVGILEALTGGQRLGLVEPQRLLSITPDSEIGRWWEARRSLLTSMLYRLDTRIIALPPSTSIPILRRHGPDEVVEMLKDLELPMRTDGELVNYLQRSDLGRFIEGTAESTSEGRGRTSTTSPSMFDLMAQSYSFGSGRDKPLNRAMGSAIEGFIERVDTQFDSVTVESKIDTEIPLIPDVALHSPGLVMCLEFHWRSGDFLTRSHRSEVAQYVLRKVRSYGRALGWIDP